MDRLRRQKQAGRLRDDVPGEVLQNYLDDNLNAWELQADGHYVKLRPGDDPPHSAQGTLLDRKSVV